MSSAEEGDILHDWSHWVEILRYDRLTCVYCGLDGKKDVESFWQIVGSLDHLIPRSAGGPDTPDNLVTCCWPCNKRKSDWDPRDRSDGKPVPTPREKMIQNVKARWQDDRTYWEAARREFLKRLGAMPEMPSNLVHSVDAALSRMNGE